MYSLDVSQRSLWVKETASQSRWSENDIRFFLTRGPVRHTETEIEEFTLNHSEQHHRDHIPPSDPIVPIYQKYGLFTAVIPSCTYKEAFKIDCDYPLGRHLLLTKEGLLGFGPVGDVSGGKEPPVRVGNHVVYLSTVSQPMILRSVPGRGDHFRIVGPCHLPDLPNFPLLRDAAPDSIPVVEIKIL